MRWVGDKNFGKDRKKQKAESRKHESRKQKAESTKAEGLVNVKTLFPPYLKNKTTLVAGCYTHKKQKTLLHYYKGKYLFWYEYGMDLVWRWYGDGMDLIWTWYGDGMELT